MRHYNAATAKRHIGFSNSPVIRQLDRGRLQMSSGRTSKVKTCEKYRDGKGKLRYKGTKQLKGTELLGKCSLVTIYGFFDSDPAVPTLNTRSQGIDHT